MSDTGKFIAKKGTKSGVSAVVGWGAKKAAGKVIGSSLGAVGGPVGIAVGLAAGAAFDYFCGDAVEEIVDGIMD